MKRTRSASIGVTPLRTRRGIGDGRSALDPLKGARLALSIVLSYCPVTALEAATDAPEPLSMACPFIAGQTVAETHPESPRGTDIPIDHIVFVMQENRSFDHLFQTLPAYGQADVDIAPAETSNRDRQGVVRPISRATSPCTDGPPHSWNAVHAQMNGGRMDGFAASGGGNAMIHYDADWLPFYYSLANTFAIADRYFSSVPRAVHASLSRLPTTSPRAHQNRGASPTAAPPESPLVHES